jgi:hypothetical protein
VQFIPNGSDESIRDIISNYPDSAISEQLKTSLIQSGILRDTLHKQRRGAGGLDIGSGKQKAAKKA